MIFVVYNCYEVSKKMNIVNKLQLISIDFKMRHFSSTFEDDSLKIELKRF